MVTVGRGFEWGLLQRCVSGFRRVFLGPCRSLPFGPMLVGLVLVLTTSGCEIMTASGNLIAMAVSPVVTVPLSDAEKVPDVEMRFHGYWCGPGHPTEEEKQSGIDLAPVDLLEGRLEPLEGFRQGRGPQPLQEGLLIGGDGRGGRRSVRSHVPTDDVLSRKLKLDSAAHSPRSTS